ncbi:MAG: PEP-CTERM sorting domain-containing protein [Gemmatimonadetes bacterium]|nr:PEP-CTERM sorting domain-containing protein [Gemmatimonadota bacterium]
MTVSGNTVTLRIWNLAGLPGSSTFANTGFTAVGLTSLGSGLTFQNLQAYYPNGTAYAGWSFAQSGGGIPGPVGSDGVSISGVGSSIFSQYATSIAGGGSPAVTSWAGSGHYGSGFVSFSFQTFTTNCTGNGSNQVCIDTETTITLTNAILGLHAQAGPAGQSTGYECLATSPSPTATQTNPCGPPPPPTVVPEPATMILPATGLMALAGADAVRRRRKKSVL